MFDLTGKRALVTGSSQGIGRELAKALSDAGAAVFVHGLTDGEKLHRATDYVGAVGSTCADLCRTDCAERLHAQTGDVDILVLCASMQIKKAWDAYTAEEFDMHMSCNLKSSYLLIQTYAEGMKARGWGRIVTIGSVNQYNNHPQLLLYAVSKAAQFKMVQNIASTLAPYGITVNNIAPGAIDTPRNAEALLDPVFRKDVISKIPAGYIGSPSDMNGAVLMLCSEQGRYITGSEIIADGGMHL